MPIETELTGIYLPAGISIHEVVKGNNCITFLASRGSRAHLFVENLDLKEQKHMKYEEL